MVGTYYSCHYDAEEPQMINEFDILTSSVDMCHVCFLHNSYIIVGTHANTISTQEYFNFKYLIYYFCGRFFLNFKTINPNSYILSNYV